MRYYDVEIVVNQSLRKGLKVVYRYLYGVFSFYISVLIVPLTAVPIVPLTAVPIVFPFFSSIKLESQTPSLAN